MDLYLQLHMLWVLVTWRGGVVYCRVDFALGGNVVEARGVNPTSAAVSWSGWTRNIVGSGTRKTATAAATCGEVAARAATWGGGLRVGSPMLREWINWRFYGGGNIFTSLKVEERNVFVLWIMIYWRCFELIFRYQNQNFKKKKSGALGLLRGLYATRGPWTVWTQIVFDIPGLT